MPAAFIGDVVHCAGILHSQLGEASNRFQTEGSFPFLLVTPSFFFHILPECGTCPSIFLELEYDKHKLPLTHKPLGLRSGTEEKKVCGPSLVGKPFHRLCL